CACTFSGGCWHTGYFDFWTDRPSVWFCATRRKGRSNRSKKYLVQAVYFAWEQPLSDLYA
ncbi:MAG TPA: hypothetical protein VG537_02270, partial [Candidatus Kapabacteria bacterium]|nr:hypothetical protein [Candidatus Kapabacteria bacterium]